MVPVRVLDKVGPCEHSRISSREVSPFLERNCVISSMILQYTYDNDTILWKNTNDFTIYITYDNDIIKGSLGGETSVLRTFGMSGKELVKERVSEGKS
jgi:hypothetical protein